MFKRVVSAGLLAVFLTTNVFSSPGNAALSLAPVRLPSVRVQSSHPLSKNTSGVSFYLIEDIHSNLEAQKNIGQTLSQLQEEADRDGLKLIVCAEAAAGRFDFSPFRRFPDKTVLPKIADYLLENDLISAVSWFGLTHDNAAVIGVDDPASYLANVESYQKSYLKKERLMRNIDAETARLASIAGQTLAGVERAAFFAVRDYNAGLISIRDVARPLAALNNQPLPVSLARFIQAVDLEAGINRDQVEKERVQFLNYENGRPTLSKFPALAAYLDYAQLVQSLPLESIHKDLDQLIASVPSPLIAKLRDLSLLGKLVRFELTESEWASYQRRRPVFFESLKTFEDFYRLADRRSAAIAANALNAARHERASRVVVIAGGFHTLGIKSRLEKNGTVAVMTPKLTDISHGADTSSLKGFLKGHDALQKLFYAKRSTVADAAQMLGAPQMPSSRAWPKALPVIAFLMAAFAAKSGVQAAEQAAVLSASHGAMSLVGAVGSNAVVHMVGGANLMVGPSLGLLKPIAEIGQVAGLGNVAVAQAGAWNPLLAFPMLRFAGAIILLAVFVGIVTYYVIDKTQDKPEHLPDEIKFQNEREKSDRGMRVPEPYRRLAMRTYFYAALSIATTPIHAALVRLTIWWFAEMTRKRAIESIQGFNPADVEVYSAGAEVPIGPFKAEIYRKIVGGWSVWLNTDGLWHRTHLPEIEPYLKNAERVRVVNREKYIEIYPIDVSGREIAEPVLINEFGHAVFLQQVQHPRTGYSISAPGSITYGLLGLPLGIAAFLTLYQTHPTLSIAVLAWPALVIAQGVMLWVLQRPVFRRVVPIGPTGYRLISSLTHPYAAAWKIAWLKYKQPVLASEHAYLFDERDPSSLYATISISKTVWLDRLDPSLPHQKVILVNEKNANTLMQVISLPHELFHLKFFHIEYVPKGLLGIVMNPIIFLIDEIVYFPSAVIAFAMLPFFVLYDAGYRLRSMARHWAYHEILGPDLRRYLADYRDPDLGTKYTPAMIDYLNSDPDVVNSRTHEIVRLSTLIDGLSWRAALLAIIQALPPIHMASALPFDRFNKLTVEHANPALGGAGVLPQPESNIVPLSEGTDRPITDLTKSDLKEGRRLGRAAMSAGAWAIVLNVAGEGRRWVANSIRIPGFMTKAFSLSFGLNYGQGLKNAMSMGLNSLSRRIPEDGVVRIEIMSQDLNHTFVQDALAWDPELELNSERMKITVDPLRGVPSWHPEGGVKWIEPQALQIDGSEYRLLTRPPGALSSFVTLLANGRLLEWAEAGVRYVKFANGDDVGGVPDGNEMDELEKSGKDVLFALVKRNVTFHLKGPWHPQDWTARVVIQGEEKVVETSGLPAGVTVKIENGLPVLQKDGHPVEFTIEKTEYEKGGTPVWANGRAAIKDDHELKHLSLEVQNQIRQSSRYYNSNQALFHLPRTLKRLGFWEGDLDAPADEALAAANAMTPQERLNRILNILDEAGIVPAVDSGALAEGSEVRFNNLGWKLGDVLGFLDGWFMVIDRDGVDTESAYLALKTGDQPHSEPFLARVAHVVRNLVGQVSEPFRLPPPHYTNVTAVKLVFIAGSLIKGRPYWAPNLWHLPQQQGETPDPHPQLAVTIERRKMIEHIESEAMTAVYQKFLGPDGKLRPDQVNKALNLSVILLGEEIYRRGWKIVVQDKSTPYKGIQVDSNKVVFHIAPAADDARSVETLPIEYGVQIKELPPRADASLAMLPLLADPSLKVVLMAAGLAAVYFAWKYFSKRRAERNQKAFRFDDVALVHKPHSIDVLMPYPVSEQPENILKHDVLRGAVETILASGQVTVESINQIAVLVGRNNALGRPVMNLDDPTADVRQQAEVLAAIADEAGLSDSINVRDVLVAIYKSAMNASVHDGQERVSMPHGRGVYVHYRLDDFKLAQINGGLDKALVDLTRSLHAIKEDELSGVVLTIGDETKIAAIKWLKAHSSLSLAELSVIEPDYSHTANPVRVQNALVHERGLAVNWILARPLQAGYVQRGAWEFSVPGNNFQVIIDMINIQGEYVRIRLQETFDAAREALKAA